MPLRGIRLAATGRFAADVVLLRHDARLQISAERDDLLLDLGDPRFQRRPWDAHGLRSENCSALPSRGPRLRS